MPQPLVLAKPPVGFGCRFSAHDKTDKASAQHSISQEHPLSGGAIRGGVRDRAPGNLTVPTGNKRLPTPLIHPKCLEPFRIGLGQIHEFQSAAAGKAIGLERLHRCREYVAVVVTFEPTYLASSTLVKDLIRSDLPASMQTMNWASISLDDVEWAETHLSGGEVDVASFFRHLTTAQPHEVIDAAAKHSKRNYGDSALWRKEEELYGRLGTQSF